jgi:hypothetical protein
MAVLGDSITEADALKLLQACGHSVESAANHFYDQRAVSQSPARATTTAPSKVATKTSKPHQPSSASASASNSQLKRPAPAVRSSSGKAAKSQKKGNSGSKPTNQKSIIAFMHSPKQPSSCMQPAEKKQQGSQVCPRLKPVRDSAAPGSQERLSETAYGCGGDACEERAQRSDIAGAPPMQRDLKSEGAPDRLTATSDDMAKHGRESNRGEDNGCERTAASQGRMLSPCHYDTAGQDNDTCMGINAEHDKDDGGGGDDDCGGGNDGDDESMDAQMHSQDEAEDVVQVLPSGSDPVVPGAEKGGEQVVTPPAARGQAHDRRDTRLATSKEASVLLPLERCGCCLCHLDGSGWLRVSLCPRN